MSVNHLKNSLADGKYQDVAFGRLPIKGDLCFSRSDSSYVYALYALGRGEWEAIEAVFWKGKKLANTEWNFHSGATATAMNSGSQTVDPFFPKDSPHSGTATIGVRITLADADTLNNPPVEMELIAKTKKCANFNTSGVQTGFSYSTNPARQIAQILLDYARLPFYPSSYASAAAYILSRIDWVSWCAWRDWCDGLELNDYRTIEGFQGFGLTAKYYSGTNFQTFSESFVHPNFDISYTLQPPATVTSVPLSARFDGYIKFLYSENYTFYVTHDDGTRLKINNVSVVDQWSDTSPVTHSGTYSATADVFTPIQIDWYDQGGEGVLKVEWESSSQTREVIPSKFLYPKEESRPRYESHIFFSQPTKPVDAIGEILRTNNGFMVDIDGKLTFGSYDTLAPAHNFSDAGGSIVEGSFAAMPPPIARNPLVTEWRANMRDSNTRFVESPVLPPSYFPENNLLQTPNEFIDEVALYACTIWKAFKVLKFTAKKMRDKIGYRFSSPENLSWSVCFNDLVTISHRKTGAAKTFLVVSENDPEYDRNSDAPLVRNFQVIEWEGV